MSETNGISSGSMDLRPAMAASGSTPEELAAATLKDKLYDWHQDLRASVTLPPVTLSAVDVEAPVVAAGASPVLVQSAAAKRKRAVKTPGFRLTDRDQQIVVFLVQHRVATLPLLHRAFFPAACTPEAVHNWLRRMIKAGLVVKAEGRTPPEGRCSNPPSSPTSSLRSRSAGRS